MTPHLLSLALAFAAPDQAPPPRAVPAAQAPASPADRLEVVFFTRERPVRLSVAVNYAGGTMTDRWRTHVTKLFAASDRDGDGFLDEKEADTIIPVSGVRQIFQGGYFYRVGNPTPELKELDRDGDHRLSLGELQAYYRDIEKDLVKPRSTFVANFNNPTTEELFDRLDRNGDNKLGEAEVKAAERILAGLDTDEDECVSANEILRNRTAVAATMSTTDAAMMMNRPATAPKTRAAPQDLQVFQAAIPGAIVQQFLKRYDADNDLALTNHECGFHRGAFDRLDRNADGKLSATELDGWRASEPDGTVAITMAARSEDCKIAAKPAGASSWPKGIEVRQTEPGRLVLNVAKQTIEFSAHMPPTSVQKRRTSQFMAGVFPQGKQEVADGDLVGPQYQLVRVIFDAADANGNGKLTRKEFETYFAMQQATAEIALSLNYATRTPNFFQMLDDNLDGKLSVRELRTAWERLIVLEPGEGKAVTRAVMQPSANLRVVQASLVQFDPTQNAVSRPGAKAPSAAPLWHRKMDRNTDGDVSKAEFLGDADAFARLDGNKDALVSTEEAVDYEKAARPKKK